MSDQFRLTRRGLVFGSAAACLPLAGCAQLMFPEKSVGRIHHVVGADLSRSRTIQWECDGVSVLELRQGTNGYISRFASAGEHTTVGEFNLRLHTVILRDLEPDTVYEYRIGEDMPWTSFRTASESSACRALIFSDSQSKDNYRAWGDVYSFALARHDRIDFSAHLGDLVDQGTSTHEWYQWFEQTGVGLRSLPVAPVMGSHETYHKAGGKIQVVYPDIYLHAFPVPWNGSRTFSR